MVRLRRLRRIFGVALSQPWPFFPLMKRLLLTSAAAILTLFSGQLMADPLAVGAEAPKVEAKDQNGKNVKLEDLYKKGLTLVYFYPKADTPGCTKEACGLRDSTEELKKLKLQVVGVSMDKVEDQKKFEEKYQLNFTLLADTEGAVVKGFGVPELKPGIPKRQSFLVKDGKIVWRDLEVKADKHAESVKTAAAEATKK